MGNAIVIYVLSHSKCTSSVNERIFKTLTIFILNEDCLDVFPL